MNDKQSSGTVSSSDMCHRKNIVHVYLGKSIEI
jgi:hypothetical protein